MNFQLQWALNYFECGVTLSGNWALNIFPFINRIQYSCYLSHGILKFESISPVHGNHRRSFYVAGAVVGVVLAVVAVVVVAVVVVSTLLQHLIVLPHHQRISHPLPAYIKIKTKKNQFGRT